MTVNVEQVAGMMDENDAMMMARKCVEKLSDDQLELLRDFLDSEVDAREDPEEDEEDGEEVEAKDDDDEESES